MPSLFKTPIISRIPTCDGQAAFRNVLKDMSGPGEGYTFYIPPIMLFLTGRSIIK